MYYYKELKISSLYVAMLLSIVWMLYVGVFHEIHAKQIYISQVSMCEEKNCYHLLSTNKKNFWKFLFHYEVNVGR